MNRTAFMAIMTLLLYFSLIMQCNFVITSLIKLFINIISHLLMTVVQVTIQKHH